MLQLTLVGDVEADGFALLDIHRLTLDQHLALIVFEQSDVDCAVNLGGVTRHADHHCGWLGLPMSAVVCTCSKGRC